MTYDDDQRYDELFETHESFMIHLCTILNMDYTTASEMDILHAVVLLDLDSKFLRNVIE